jgi:hypothetical protein
MDTNDTKNRKEFINNFSDVAERLHVLPPKTLSFYLVALFLVFPTWSLIPLSWTVVSYMMISGYMWSCSWLARIVFILALSEVHFFCRLLSNTLTERLSTPPGTFQPLSLSTHSEYIRSFPFGKRRCAASASRVPSHSQSRPFG